MPPQLQFNLIKIKKWHHLPLQVESIAIQLMEILLLKTTNLNGLVLYQIKEAVSSKLFSE